LLLALARGCDAVVSADRLVEALWGEVRRLLHRADAEVGISVARELGQAADGVLVTQAPGYVVHADAGC
jgi:hypothetical protein